MNEHGAASAKIALKIDSGLPALSDPYIGDGEFVTVFPIAGDAKKARRFLQRNEYIPVDRYIIDEETHAFFL